MLPWAPAPTCANSASGVSKTRCNAYHQAGESQIATSVSGVQALIKLVTWILNLKHSSKIHTKRASANAFICSSFLCDNVRQQESIVLALVTCSALCVHQPRQVRYCIIFWHVLRQRHSDNSRESSVLMWRCKMYSSTRATSACSAPEQTRKAQMQQELHSLHTDRTCHVSKADGAF